MIVLGRTQIKSLLEQNTKTISYEQQYKGAREKYEKKIEEKKHRNFSSIGCSAPPARLIAKKCN